MNAISELKILMTDELLRQPSLQKNASSFERIYSASMNAGINMHYALRGLQKKINHEKQFHCCLAFYQSSDFFAGLNYRDIFVNTCKCLEEWLSLII